MCRKNEYIPGSFEIFLNIPEENDIVLKDENAKLQKTDNVIYAIWNLPCMITCPYATDACKAACYAELPEKDFRKNNVVPARMRNLNIAMSDDFQDKMISYLEKMLARPAYKNRSEIRVRIHESGDFFSKKYAMDWVAIARHFVGVKKLVFMAYTKSLPFFDGVDLPENFVLRSSIWQDTSLEMLEMTKKNGWPIYMAVPEEMVSSMPESFTLCTCENCSTCEKHCFTRANKNMFVALHGREAKKLKKDVNRLKDIVAMF